MSTFAAAGFGLVVGDVVVVDLTVVTDFLAVVVVRLRIVRFGFVDRDLVVVFVFVVVLVVLVAASDPPIEAANTAAAAVRARRTRRTEREFIDMTASGDSWNTTSLPTACDEFICRALTRFRGATGTRRRRTIADMRLPLRLKLSLGLTAIMVLISAGAAYVLLATRAVARSMDEIRQRGDAA